jgi:hypothetical protein
MSIDLKARAIPVVPGRAWTASFLKCALWIFPRSIMFINSYDT